LDTVLVLLRKLSATTNLDHVFLSISVEVLVVAVSVLMRLVELKIINPAYLPHFFCPQCEGKVNMANYPQSAIRL
jgi:hypothetical protein